MSQELMKEAPDQLAEAKKGNDAVAETSIYSDETKLLPPKMKKLIKPILIFMAFQVVVMILGRILKQRYLRQEVGKDEVNAVGVIGAGQAKVTTQAFKGGYLRAVMGGVELDLGVAAIETPPATLEATVIMGGAEIKAPQDWVVKNEAWAIMGGVQDMRGQEVSLEDATPDLVITGNVIMGGLVVNC